MIQKVGNIILFLLLTLLLHPLVTNTAIGSSGSDEFLYALKLYEEGYFELAAEQFERCIRDHPELPDLDRAQFYVALSHSRVGKYDNARAGFLKTAITYDSSPLAPEALFRVGDMLDSLDRKLDAAKAYIRVYEYYPKNSFALLGVQRAVNLYVEQDDLVKAESAIDLMINKYPEADIAFSTRIKKAEILLLRGDIPNAQRYLEWVSARCPVDSVKAKALRELALIHKRNDLINKAITALEDALQTYPDGYIGALIRIDLARVLNIQGRNLRAIEIVKPVTEIKNTSLSGLGWLQSGDAHYLQKLYADALGDYDKAADTYPMGALKAAWTCEATGEFEQAIARYNKLLEPDSEVSIPSALRLAWLHSQRQDWQTASKMWRTLIDEDLSGPLTWRCWYEYMFSARSGGFSYSIPGGDSHIDSEVLHLSDDIAYLRFSYQLQKAKLERTSEPPDYRQYFSQFPISPYISAAEREFSYYLLVERQSPDLMEKMAGLYSRPPGSVSDANWALDWGNFYLNDLKEPHKALDQYQKVLDDYLSSPGQIDSALGGRVTAYTRLLRKAVHERDEFDIDMYSDSSISAVKQFVEVNSKLDAAAEYVDKIYVELENASRLNNNLNEEFQAFEADIYKDFELSDLPYDLLDRLMQRMFDGLSTDSMRNQQFKIEINRRLTHAESSIDSASFIWNLVRLLDEMGDTNSIVLAEQCYDNFPESSPGVMAAVWLAHNPNLHADQRLELLQFIEGTHPYLIDYVDLTRLKATIFDLRGEQFKALVYNEMADSAESFTVPVLDILQIPSAEKYFELGRLYWNVGDLINAKLNLERSLNFGSSFDAKPDALYILAKINHARKDPHGALVLLDSLDQTYNGTEAQRMAMYLKPSLHMTVGNYSLAIERWNNIIAVTSDPDSQFNYRSQIIVCHYRLGKLEEARTAAKKLYKDFEHRSDLDNYKALFYLEKGRAKLKVRAFDEARKQFDIIKKNYTASEWIDEAEFYSAWSFIEQKKLKEGAEALELCAENYPDSSISIEALYQAGITHYKIEQYSQSSVALQKVWNNPNAESHWAITFAALIKVYNDLRFYDAGIRLTRDYLDRFPDAPDVFNRKIYIGWAYLQIGEWDEALRFYTPLLPHPDKEIEAEIQYYIGEAYMGKGEYKTAILEFLKVKILGRKTKLDWGVTALYQAGVCYEKLGEKDGAARMYNRIIREAGETSNYGRTALVKLEALNENE